MSMNQNKNLIISYLTMRRLIGILGIALPIIVILGGSMKNGLAIQGSISSYYYTNMRDFFVGLLCVVSLFLISYKGYEKIDDIVGNLSGIFAFGMIIFPVSMYSGKIVKVGMFLIDDNISEYFHYIFGALFFLLLSFNSIFLFTKSEPGALSREKKRRNAIYHLCGIIMILASVCIFVYLVFFRGTIISKIHPVLILESIALLAFGVSWLVKGHVLFRDKKN